MGEGGDRTPSALITSDGIEINEISPEMEDEQYKEHNLLTDDGSGKTIGKQHKCKPGNQSKQTRCREFKMWFLGYVAPKNLCPTLNWPLQIFSFLVFFAVLWGSSYTLLQDEVAPQSSLFMLVMLIIMAYIGGLCIRPLRLPPLLGMLIVGIVLRNLNLFNMKGPYKTVVTTLRSLAMLVILIKAGLGLDAKALRKMSLTVVRLAFIPCLTETAVVTCMSHLILGIPWFWGLLLGFVLAAVSPAVVVPSLLHLKEQGYGEDKGIATLVIAASSIDDIVAISGFGVILGMIFSEGNLLQQLLQGPLEVAIGLSFGIGWGIVCIYIPHKDFSSVVSGRIFMVGGGAIFALFGSQLIDFSGAGPLATILIAFVACCGWKSQGWSSSYNPVEKQFSNLWMVFQPVLFGLIGTEINLSALEGHIVGKGIAVLCCGLLIRIIVSFLAVFGGNLNYKEMFFVAISWFPKATVQAALGPVALDYATKYDADENMKEYSTQVLNIAVLSILLTAPLGAIGIYLSGPRLLNKPQTPIKEEASDENI